jgi:hypothetical protein
MQSLISLNVPVKENGTALTMIKAVITHIPQHELV